MIAGVSALIALEVLNCFVHRLFGLIVLDASSGESVHGRFRVGFLILIGMHRLDSGTGGYVLEFAVAPVAVKGRPLAIIRHEQVQITVVIKIGESDSRAGVLTRRGGKTEVEPEAIIGRDSRCA